MIARFISIEDIATGVHGTIHRALDERTNREVALKRAARSDARAVSQLRNEAAMLVRLQGIAGVAAFVDASEEAAEVWIAREWVTGSTLDALLDRGPMPQDAARAMFARLLDVVHSVHQCGVVHGDLSERNVVVDVAERPWLIDFGNASSLELAQPNTTGSVHHMAPELFDHHPPDVRTDLYALGVTFYRMLSGRLPFEGDTKPQVITAHLRQSPASLGTAMDRWVLPLMAKDRAQRPASAAAARALLAS